MSVIPVILSGGSGTRLWPLSREGYPKQFLTFTGKHSLFQQTLLRTLFLKQSPIIISNEKHRFLVAEQLQLLSSLEGDIILEPEGRNTAPAVALAALYTLAKQSNSSSSPILLILPADHIILNEETFQQTIKQAIPIAEQGKLVTFGIVPTHPETGYGYIKTGEYLSPAYKVDAFVEKPDLKTAEQYLASKKYYWNSGMFMFRADSYIDALRIFAPDILEACQTAMHNMQKDLDFIRADQKSFQSCRSDSIDYAVMEKANNSMVIPLDAGWSDIGAWSSLWEVLNKTPENNVIKGDALAIDTHNSFIYSNHRFVATLGLENMIVIETSDAVLVTTKDQAQNIKKIVSEIKTAKRSEANLHREVYRPWGSYDGIDQGERYQVKHIQVKPGAALSLQKHYHRAEHWIVVKGTAKVTCDDKTFLVRENESTYIPLGSVHRLENPGKITLEMIEVQSGSYLGEDDIERLKDVYGRQ